MTLLTERLPHVHFPEDWANQHPACLLVTCGQHVSPGSFLLSRPELPLHSLPTQIPHDAELTQIPYTGRKFFPTRNRTSAASYRSNCRFKKLNQAIILQLSFTL